MIKNYPLNHLKITPGNLERFLSYIDNCIDQKKKSYCIPLNLTKYEISKKDQKLRKVIRNANFVIADGIPIRWLSARLGYDAVSRITGIELAEAILNHSKAENWKICLFGASSDILERAKLYVEEKYNHPHIVGSIDGYFSSKRVDQIVEQINELRPDLLFLGLGMPQKEYFIHDYLEKINAVFWLPVGGAFDIWAQAKRRSPKFIQKAGLEWLQRSFYNKTKAKNIMRNGLSFLKDLIFIGK